MVLNELLEIPGAISGQGDTPIEYIEVNPIVAENTETINFNEAKDLFANLNTKEMLGEDSLKYGNLTKKELLLIFGEIPNPNKHIKLEDIDMKELQKKVKIYSDIAYYAYKHREAKDDDPDHIKGINGYPLEEPDYILAAEYDKKIIDIYSIVISGLTIDPGKNYEKLETQIVRFLVHTLKKFSTFIDKEKEQSIQKIIEDLGGISPELDASLEKTNYPTISEEERKEYKSLIQSITERTRYLTMDIKDNKTFEFYFPITEKYDLLTQALANITGNHYELAKALNIEASLLEEKIRYISSNQSENMKRAMKTIKNVEEEFSLIGEVKTGESENNIGEIYFNVNAYGMALMSYKESLNKKSEAYRAISNKLDTLENNITETSSLLNKDIKQNKKEDMENKIQASELDKYFLDYGDASSDFSDILAAFEKKIKKHKTVDTEAFTQISKDISLSTKTIKTQLRYLKKNDKYIDKAGLEEIQKHLVVLSDLLYEFSKIINTDASYINIGKSNIVMGIQVNDEKMLKKGKDNLDIAEKFQNLLGNNDAEVNYYLGEYYKVIRDFRKAQEYFLKVYGNPNADVEYRYKAASGIEFTSFTYKDKFEREAKEEEMKKLYEEISQRIQDSMNEYESVVAAEQEAQIEQDQLKAEGEQTLRERDQKAALVRQRTLFGSLGGGLLLSIAFLGLLYTRRKNRIIVAQKEKVERVTSAVNKSGQAILIKTSDGEILFSNEVYRNILKKDIVSPRGKMAKIFKEVVETGKERIFTELVIWKVDPTKLSEEERQKIEAERTKSVSKYIYLKEGGNEVIREQRYYKITLTPSLDNKGKVTEVSSISDDATKEELDKQVKEQQKIEIELQKMKVEKQAEIVAKHLKDIQDSINYAKKIQDAVLPQQDQLDSHLGDHFVLFKPKDVVSGDFYWTHQYKSNPNKVIFAAVDCTGHGVAGAFMSMLGKSFLDEIVNTNEDFSTGEILEQLHLKVRLALKEKANGMDMSICILDKKTRELQYSGARNEIYIVNPEKGMTALSGVKSQVVPSFPSEETKKIAGPESVIYPLYKDKHGKPFDIIEISGVMRGINQTFHEYRPFEVHNLMLEEGMIVYGGSDGYVDQAGGGKGRKLMKKRYRELLIEVSRLSMEKQKKALDVIIEKRRMQNPDLEQIQVDDIVVMGVKI